MKKTALFLFMLFAFVTKVQEKIFLGEVDREMKYYIYPKTVKKSEKLGYITAWFLYEHAIPQESPNGYYTKAKNQFLINCKYNKFGIIMNLSYSKDYTLIYRTESVNEYLVKEYSVVPGSTGERMVKAACLIYDKTSN